MPCTGEFVKFSNCRLVRCVSSVLSQLVIWQMITFSVFADACLRGYRRDAILSWFPNSLLMQEFRTIKKGGGVKPVLQALVLAEHVYDDSLSGKKIIAGTFNTVLFSKRSMVRETEVRETAQPDGAKQAVIAGGMHSGSPFAYVSLTDVVEKPQLLCQFVNLTKNQVLFGNQITVDCEDRLATVELILPLPSLPISEEGFYAFELVCEGEILGSCRIKATELKPPENE